MANAVLIDSSFYIRRFRENRDPFLELIAFADAWTLATCGMIKIEVCRGLRQPRMRRRYEEAFAVMLYAPTSNAVWEHAAAMAWQLDRRGDVLPAQDILIAACAFSIDAAVLTCDSHFQRIPRVRTLTSLKSA